MDLSPPVLKQTGPNSGRASVESDTARSPFLPPALQRPSGFIKVSDSPRRSPLVQDSVHSPVRSVHPDVTMATLYSAVDYGHRTADFFDDTTDDEIPESPVMDRTDRWDVGIAVDHPRHTNTKRKRPTTQVASSAGHFPTNCDPQRVSSPTAIDRYLQSVPHAVYDLEEGPRHSSGDESFDRSVEELSPPRTARKSRLQGSGSRTHRARRSRSVDSRAEESPILPKPVGTSASNKADQILGVHALTLKALESLEPDRRAAPVAQPLAHRTSKHTHRPATVSRLRSASAPAKKVSMVPPPINTSTRAAAPDQRTPYPWQQQFHRKDFGRSPLSSGRPISLPAVESLLTLTIRRNNKHSRLRMSTLVIPANSDFTAVKNEQDKEKHFVGLDFDDAKLFHQLNLEYRKLLGPYRFFSARTLSHVAISGDASRAADAGYGWLIGPRSPRIVAAKGLSDTFSEDKLLTHLRNPSLGKSRYAWVGWAHRLSAAPAASHSVPPTPGTGAAQSPAAEAAGTNRNSLIRRREQHEGLEFVVSWSAARIAVALVMVLALSVTATLLWVFVGRSSRLRSGDAVPDGAVVIDVGGGYRDAGDRVGAAVGLGIGVLVMGLTAFAGWVGLSWLLL